MFGSRPEAESEVRGRSLIGASSLGSGGGGGECHTTAWAKSGPQPVFVKKVLLELGFAHLLVDYLRSLSQYKGRVE